MSDPDRPSPEALLRQAEREARGRLKIFLGAAPGVGKTFEMLSDGAARLRAGVDVVIAIVETHGRAETAALVAPLEQVPLAEVEHRGHRLAEMNLDGVLARAPALALVDEFAHSNAPGSRHPKRWQDVEELLAAGIDVYTTLNIQHVESLNDVVASFTHVRVRETVPDRLLERAEIELVDLPPDELIERLREGKVYVPAEASRALGHFFSKANLSALRELALRKAAERVDRQMLDDLDASGTGGRFAGGERVLVAVSEQHGAEALVRAAKRLADAMHAPWTAVFIETPRAAAFDQRQQAAVSAVLRLAVTLGATIVTVPAPSVIEGLRSQVGNARATQLVLGRSRRSWWFQLRHRSVVEAIVKSEDGLAIHVIPASAEPARKSEGRRRVRSSFGVGPLVALGSVALTTVLAEALHPLVGTGGTDLVYLFPVVLIAGWLGLGAGLVAGVSAALAYNFFFLPPIYTFNVADPQSVLTLVVFVLLAGLVSELAARLRARALLSTRSAEESAAVAAFGQALARANDWAATAQVICDELARLLDVETLLLRRRDDALATLCSRPPAVELGAIDRAAADWCVSRGEEAGRGTDTLPASEWQFHPLRTSLGVLAIVGVARADGAEPVPLQRALLLATLLGQAALSLERLSLDDELRDVALLRERDRLRGALLSSIAHDLRTPLTAVAVALDAANKEHPLSAALALARSELRRLRRFFDDLLGIVRADSGALKPRIELIDLLDAVSSARADVREMLVDNDVQIRLPTDLPLVGADSRLLHHVLINILTNATRHGGRSGQILIEATVAADRVDLLCRDHGPGLSASVRSGQHVGPNPPRMGDDADGSGLGLAIVRSFCDAMGIAFALGDHGAGVDARLSFPTTNGNLTGTTSEIGRELPD